VLRVRRFFCDNTGCPAKTFAEQVPGLMTPRARRTGLLKVTLEAVGPVHGLLSGEEAAAAAAEQLIVGPNYRGWCRRPWRR
jgi:hypothetical protein